VEDAGARLLERSEELGRVRARVAEAAAGTGSVLLIEGEAGVGKTTLLEAAVGLAAEDGLRVLRARAGQLEREVGWNLVRQLFDEVIRAGASSRSTLLRGAAGLALPALGLRPGSDAGALHGLYWLTAELAEQGPLVIAVDDAHWGDLVSLHYLTYLAERIDDLPIVLAVTVRRGEELPGPLTILASRPRSEVMSLRELSAAASAELARGTLGTQADDGFCEACFEATRGNPFLLYELLRQLGRDGVDPTTASASEVGRITPASVRRSVLLRLSRLPEDSRELATAIAILGEAGLPEAAGLAAIEPEQVSHSADTLSTVGILAPGTPLQFVHAIVREVVYAELPPLQRARLHRQAAQVLAEQGHLKRAAAQLLETIPESDPWVVVQLRAAAAAALAEGAPAIASSLLQRAVREPAGGQELAGILVTLGRAEAAAGGPNAAQRMSQAVELTSEPRDRAEIQLELGRLLYLAGRPGAAAEAFDAGLRDLAGDSNGDRSLVAELQAGWLTVARLEIPLRSKAEEMTHAIAADPPMGGSYGERALLAHISGQLTFEGAPREQAIELAYRALGDGELIRQETSDGLSWVAAMGALGWGDDFDGFEALQQDALADARRRGSVLGFATAMYGNNFSHYYRGMLAEAVADAEQAIAAERDGWRHFLTSARAQLGWALIELGELDSAAAQLDQAAVDAALEQTSAQGLVLEARARIELIRGEPQLALQSALAAGKVFTDARISNPSILPWRSRAAIAADATGDRERAEELLGEELELARRFGAPRPIGVALIATGIVRRAEGVQALEEAVTTLATSPAGLEHARANVMLGAALRRKGSINAARDRLGLGLHAAESLGASMLEERARLELSATGVRPQRRPVIGVESLTPAERRVAESAIGGLTNREIAQSLFVSLRTVETHLTHCYQKLGIQARGELVAALGAVEPRSNSG
jgi:DNA-binding CsgD family transcriptional regulator/tetratricopeptide (TPR) repeat protein